MMNTTMGLAVTLCFLLGCARPERNHRPKAGSLSISTNALVAAIPVGTHQDAVVKRFGIPADVFHGAVTFSTTNSTGGTVEVPMDVWVYLCTNGSMWVVFGTNKVVHAVEPDPGVSI